MSSIWSNFTQEILVKNFSKIFCTDGQMVRPTMDRYGHYSLHKLSAQASWKLGKTTQNHKNLD